MTKTKRSIAYFMVFFMILTSVVGVLPAKDVQAATYKYLVLIEGTNGVWKGYNNIAYKASNGGIYVNAADLASKLGYSYKNLGKGKFRIYKKKNNYLQYTKGSKTYYLYKSKNYKRSSAYTPQLRSKKYAVYCSTLSNLCNYKYVNSSKIQDNRYKKKGYTGVVCYSLKRKVVQAPPTGNVYNAKSLGLLNNNNNNNTQLSPEESAKLQAAKERAVIESVKTGSAYTTLSTSTGTSFVDGQDSTLALSTFGYDKTGGATTFNHPNGIAYDGKHFYVCDTWNNRVLVYNSLPETGSKPAYVLGQTNFTSSKAGYGLNQMNWPVGIATDGNRLYVADTKNNRVLVWNTIPTTSGKAADWSINMIDPNKSSPQDRELMWPWAVWTDGNKLIVTQTEGGKLLIWNKIPNKNTDKADIIIDTNGTVRTIVTDGKSYLMAGDHNIKSSDGEHAGFRVWTSFPTSSRKEDYVIKTDITPGGGQLSDGRIAIFADNKISIYNSKPNGSSWKPSVTIGDGCIENDSTMPYFFSGGDYNQVLEVNGRLYASCYNGDKVVGYKTIPTSVNAKPNIVLGTSNIYEDVLTKNNVYQNLNPVTDGKKLIAVDDFNDYILVWNTLPGQTGAMPSVALKLYRFAPWDCDLHNGKFAIAGKGGTGGKLAIWNSVPTTKKAPDYYYSGSIGNVKIKDLVGVAMDDNYLYVADQSCRKTYVFKGIPNSNSTPVYTLNHAGILNVNNGKLSIGDGTAWIYDVDKLSLGDSSAINIKNIVVSAFDSSGKIIKKNVQTDFIEEVIVGDKGELILSEKNNCNQVLYWDSISDAVNQKQGITLGYNDTNYSNAQLGVNSNAPKTIISPGKGTLYMPAGIAYDGTNIWVGEFKFSSRLLLFQKK